MISRWGTRFWVIAGLSLGPAVSNSFGRFAYALVLPAMRNELGWSYTQAGWLNTANAIGYLLGALLTGRYVATLGNRRLFAAGMVLTAGALILSGLTTDFALMLLLRAAAGITGAIVFVCGGVLAGNLFPQRPATGSAAIAIYFGGAGAGILLSGAAIPWLLEIKGDAAWPWAWLGIGIASALFAVLSIVAALRIEEPSIGAVDTRWPALSFRFEMVAYFLFGVGYIAYMTFVVAWMKAHGAPALEVAVVWGLLGLATLFAPVIWAGPLARWSGGAPLGGAILVIAGGALIPLLSASFLAMAASALLFGGGMFTAPSAVTTLIKKSLSKSAWGPAVAAFTVVFAIGQGIGPAVTGWLADWTGSLYSGLAASCVVLLIAAAIAFAQSDVKTVPLSREPVP